MLTKELCHVLPPRPNACQQVYNKLAPWLISSVLCAIVFERMQSYAQAVEDPKANKDEEEEELTVIGNLNQKKFDHIKTKQDACKTFEGKVVTYYDKASLVVDCKQLPIENADILNELTQRHGRALVEIPAKVYKLIPFGHEFTTTDLINLKKNKNPNVYKNCQALNGQYVTANAERYYLIDNCIKRPFGTYFDLENHNKNKKTIVTVPEDVLDAIPTGKDMSQSDNEFDILYKIDGDPNWNKLSRSTDGKIQADTPESLEKIDRESRKVNLNELCKKINKHFVSFYSVIYFVDGCTLREVKQLSIKYQRHIDASGGISDLTAEQQRALPKGKDISVQAAVELLDKSRAK